MKYLYVESCTHGLVRVQTDSYTVNKAKYTPNIGLNKIWRGILQEEDDERFVKEGFCFRFIKSTQVKAKTKTKTKASDNIEKAQWKLH